MRDFFHQWWALLYWNARKTAFAARGRRGPCPCQSPSDSGRAGQTRCEAAMSWDRPARFRRICPALEQGEDGWLCSVDTFAVRPYWGRAFAWWSGAALVACLLAASAAFLALYGRGYRDISLLDTLVPARWSRINASRRDMFLRHAREALARCDVEGMWVSLASAGAAAAGDYEARLALAQIYSHLLMSGLAETEFRALLERFPEERARTAVVYHDVLVSSGQFEALARLALAQLSTAPAADRGAWLKALFVAIRGARDSKAVEMLLREAGGLSPLEQVALEVEAALRRGDTSAWSRLSVIPGRESERALLILTGETLAQWAPPEQAIDAIIRAAPVIGPFEKERLLYRMYARVGADKLALRSFDAMLALAGRSPERERLLAALVDFPDPDRVARLSGALGNPATPFSNNELGSVWVAAALSGSDDIRRLAESRLFRDHGVRVTPDTPLTFSAANAAVWVRVLPLNRESAIALALKRAPAAGTAVLQLSKSRLPAAD